MIPALLFANEFPIGSFTIRGLQKKNGTEGEIV